VPCSPTFRKPGLLNVCCGAARLEHNSTKLRGANPSGLVLQLQLIVMHVLSTWSAPSAVYFSEKLDPVTLILAKSSRVEVIKLLEDGIRHMSGIDVWGQTKSLCILDDGVGSSIT
jgi:hypothetical protein